MKMNTLLIISALLLGIGIGYWGDSPFREYPANDYHAIARDNNALLKKTITIIDQLEKDAVTPHMAGDCRSYSELLSDIRKTINESIKNLSAGSTTATTAASRPPAPSKEQIQAYNAAKNRIYSYANSGQPIMEAMSQDPDIQNLNHEQQRQLAMEIIERFNRGEITMDQIQGN